MLDGFSGIVLLENNLFFSVGPDVILRELVNHDDQLVLMPLAESYKVFSVSTGLANVPFNLMRSLVVFIAIITNCLDEEFVSEGLRSLIILNMASDLRVLRELNHRIIYIYFQGMASPRIEAI